MTRRSVAVRQAPGLLCWGTALLVLAGWTAGARGKIAHHDAMSMRPEVWVAEAREDGFNKGLERGERKAILGICEVLGLTVSLEQKASLDRMDLLDLEQLSEHLKQHRSWPT